MNSRPSRFTVVFVYPIETCQRCEILFNGENFGQAWIDTYRPPYHEWTFNRGDVAIANEYWPPEYFHTSLPALIQHLEETFVLKSKKA